MKISMIFQFLKIWLKFLTLNTIFKPPKMLDESETRFSIQTPLEVRLPLNNLIRVRVRRFSAWFFLSRSNHIRVIVQKFHFVCNKKLTRPRSSRIFYFWAVRLLKKWICRGAEENVCERGDRERNRVSQNSLDRQQNWKKNQIHERVTESTCYDRLASFESRRFWCGQSIFFSFAPDSFLWTELSSSKLFFVRHYIDGYKNF